ncbi:MAG: ABC transporter permease [Pseudomonadota bacterium]
MADITAPGPRRSLTEAPQRSAETSGPLLAADGTPLRRKLRQALFVSRMRAMGLATPLVLFVLLAFVFPIFVLLWQAVYNDTFEDGMPRTTELLAEWDAISDPDEAMYAAVITDLIEARDRERALPTKVGARVNREKSGSLSLFKKTNRRAQRLEAPFKEAMVDLDKKWGDIEYWRAMKVASQSVSPAFVASALDLHYTADGTFEWEDPKRQIHLKLFLRTLEISLIVTLATIALGYPVAYLLATLPARVSNLLLILVLLPFWTSILVRTTSWIAMLQSQGVMNDIFVWIGITADDQRFSMIYNKLGTLIAMTHILLPFMILPLYSVMKTIPPSYVRAAKSLGATNWTAFWRIYAPQTVPGIGAGAILVFILAIGYYITPALVGGQDGVMISNIIDDHMRKSLNYSLAAALGLVLLVFVLFLYWLYDRIVGIDNMKLG